MANPWPKSTKAARKQEASNWELGDALSEECPPSENGVNNNSLGKIKDFTDFLYSSYGIIRAPATLRELRDICLVFPAEGAVRTAPLDWSIYKVFRGCPDLLGDWIKNHADETMTVKAAQELVAAHKKALEDAATRSEEDEEKTAPAEETKDEETSETDKENSAEETQPLAAKDEEIEDGQASGEDAASEITEEEGEPEPETAEELEVRRNKEKQKAEADMLEKVDTLKDLAIEIAAFAQHNDPTVPWSRQADQTMKDVVAELNWFRKWAKERDSYRTGADVKRPKQRKPATVAPLPNGGSEENSHAYQH
jgi:hypothetical protein